MAACRRCLLGRIRLPQAVCLRVWQPRLDLSCSTATGRGARRRGQGAVRPKVTAEPMVNPKDVFRH